MEIKIKIEYPPKNIAERLMHAIIWGMEYPKYPSFKSIMATEEENDGEVGLVDPEIEEVNDGEK